MFSWFKKVTASAQKKGLQKAKCPYCSYDLEKFPTRKQKCKSCGKEFAVRTHYLTEEKMVITDKDATKYDLEKEKYYRDKTLIDGLKLDTRVDKNALDKLVQKTSEELTEKFGKPASLGDVAWAVANKLSMEAVKKGDLDRLGSIQFQMALYLHNTGKDGNHILENTFDIELKRYKKMGCISKIKIQSVSESCEGCKKINGTILSIDDAIEKKLLPCKQCTTKMTPHARTGWCRCCYSPEIES